jgi:hypothetical protein
LLGSLRGFCTVSSARVRASLASVCHVSITRLFARTDVYLWKGRPSGSGTQELVLTQVDLVGFSA